MWGFLAYNIASWVRGIYGAPPDPPQAAPPQPEQSSHLTDVDARELLDDDVAVYGEAS